MVFRTTLVLWLAKCSSVEQKCLHPSRALLTTPFVLKSVRAVGANNFVITCFPMKVTKKMLMTNTLDISNVISKLLLLQNTISCCSIVLYYRRCLVHCLFSEIKYHYISSYEHLQNYNCSLPHAVTQNTISLEIFVHFIET